MQEGETFRPPSRYIGERQGVQVAALDIGATMGHEIRFQEARSGFIPLLKGANRDLLLEQRSRSSGGEARTIQFALRGQQAIRRCRAHGKQLFPALLCDLEVLMPFQRFKECGEKGNESFGADTVGGVWKCAAGDRCVEATDFSSLLASCKIFLFLSNVGHVPLLLQS